MNTSTLVILLAFMALFSYWYGIRRAIHVAGSIKKAKQLVSLPRQYGVLTALWCGIPALILLLFWNAAEHSVIEGILLNQLPAEVQQMDSDDRSLYLNDVYVMAEDVSEVQIDTQKKNIIKYHLAEKLSQIQHRSLMLKNALVLLFAVAGVLYITSRFSLKFQARKRIDAIINKILILCSAVAILTTLGILFSVLFESLQFFKSVSPMEFLFGLEWSPQMAIRADQVGSSGSFGAVPLFAGTMLITLVAMLVAVPVGLMTAIYLSQYASRNVRTFAKPALEILAGVPTVVYGFFAALTVAPLIRGFGESIGLDVASESALAAGLVMGVMIIPFVSSLSDDAISAVPVALKEGSLGMGATLSETIKRVMLPAALPGIIGAILLAVSRAIGETMIVVMAAGMSANLTANPLASVTTVTVQIVALLTGDQEFDSPKTLAAFALGLMLFVTTLVINVIALKVVRKYREQYD